MDRRKDRLSLKAWKNLTEAMLIHTECAQRVSQEAKTPEEFYGRLKGKSWRAS